MKKKSKRQYMYFLEYERKGQRWAAHFLYPTREGARLNKKRLESVLQNGAEQAARIRIRRFKIKDSEVVR